MPYYNYYCLECEKEELRHIPMVDGIFTEQVLVSSLSQEEANALPDWDDPRDYEVYEEVEYGDMPPDVVKCSCGAFADRLVTGAPDIKHGRNSYHAMKERRRYHIEGMDKNQAETFLQQEKEHENTNPTAIASSTTDTRSLILVDTHVAQFDGG